MAGVRLFAALVVVIVFALPALAHADSCQGAGDCQYQDPFGNSQPQPKTKPKTNTNPTAPAPTQQTPTQSAPVTQSQPSSTPAVTTTTPTSGSAAAGDPNGQLPRTGLDLRLVGGLGLLLAGVGALVRRWLG